MFSGLIRRGTLAMIALAAAAGCSEQPPTVPDAPPPLAARGPEVSGPDRFPMATRKVVRAGDPVSVMDPVDKRLRPGSRVVFDGVTLRFAVDSELDTRADGREGTTTAPLFGGTYRLTVLVPGIAELPAGEIEVTGGQEPATMVPVSGPPGTLFTITDPSGSMRPGDRAIFYPDGVDPEFGAGASIVSVSEDGTTLTGRVPNISSAPYFFSVRAVGISQSRFPDLSFHVTAAAGVAGVP